MAVQPPWLNINSVIMSGQRSLFLVGRQNIWRVMRTTKMQAFSCWFFWFSEGCFQSFQYNFSWKSSTHIASQTPQHWAVGNWSSVLVAWRPWNFQNLFLWQVKHCHATRRDTMQLLPLCLKVKAKDEGPFIMNKKRKKILFQALNWKKFWGFKLQSCKNFISIRMMHIFFSVGLLPNIDQEGTTGHKLWGRAAITLFYRHGNWIINGRHWEWQAGISVHKLGEINTQTCIWRGFLQKNK